MSDEVEIPALPSSFQKEYDMDAPGDMDNLLDSDPTAGLESEVRRARAGLDGDWVASSVSQKVDWMDESTYDGGPMGVLLDYDEGGWDDAILLDDD